jgi:hypothetical protein
MVLPEPGPPATKVVQPVGTPPAVMASKPGTPVDDFGSDFDWRLGLLISGLHGSRGGRKSANPQSFLQLQYR